MPSPRFFCFQGIRKLRKTTSFARALVAGLSFIALAACSGEPNANDMKQATLNNPSIKANLTMLLNAQSGLTGQAEQSASAFISEAQFERGACAAASNEPGFVCDYRINMTINGETRRGEWTKARFFQADGWQIDPAR